MRCENCEEAELVRLEGEDGGGGYICEAATEAERESGSGCGAVVAEEEVQQTKKDGVKGDKKSSNAKSKVKVEEEREEEDDSDDEESESESEQADSRRTPAKSRGGKENVAAAANRYLTPAPRKSTGKALPRARAMPASAPSTSSLSFSAAALRSKLRQQAASRLSQCSFDIDDHSDLASLNADSMVSGQLAVQRAPLMAGLSVKGEENCLSDMYRRSYVRPRLTGEATKEAQQLMAKEKWGRRLGVRGRGFGVLTGQKPLQIIPLPIIPQSVEAKVDSAADQEVIRKKEGFEPLIVWRRDQLTDEDRSKHPDRQWAEAIEVPPCIARFLRPHQREGVQFMAECVLGLRRFKGNGAILADDMGLGKTLQSISLLYTLLTQGFEQGKPIARRVCIITPTSLVGNWKNELKKWLDDRVSAVAISESSRGDVIDAVQSFLHPRSPHSVLIISYDTFRLHSALFSKPDCCDLMICDEAHRLKNSKTSTYTALDEQSCMRRILLSGTPLQNNLDEFFAMINFTNRSVLGDRKMFRKYYEQPILAGREPMADSEEQEMGQERSAELSAIVNQFVLRRTNTLLSAHLPPKVMQIVCCRPTTLQNKLYDHLLTRGLRTVNNSNGRTSDILPLIGSLKKLCNHPKLIWDEMRGKGNKEDMEATGTNGKALQRLFTGCDKYFQESGFERQPFHPQWSGKMYVLVQLLTMLRRTTDDRVVIVSNFTSALDVIGQICTSSKWPFLRLDGATSIKNRQKLVDQLSDKRTDIFCFLLSSRAGGCGLNLIGANRLVLFDPDWNPAVDKQAAARVWRDGQSKRCYIYRLLTTGSIEEKVYQRQLSKEGLADVLGGGMNEAACTRDELRQLFTRRSGDTSSDTHDHLQCDCLDHIMTSEEDAAEKQKRIQEELQLQNAGNEAAVDIAPALGELPAEAEALMDESTATTASDAESASGDEQGDGNDDDDGFVVSDDASEGEEDFDEPKAKRGGAASGKKKKKKEKGSGLRKLKRSKVDPLLAHSITKAMIGQRGSPPEEELINWAHHITPASMPDPMMRRACERMSRLRDGTQYVSFAFSCEVKGKQIGTVTYMDEEESEERDTAESAEFRQYSACCNLQPVTKDKGREVKISADDAYEKHRRMVEEHEKKRRKRLGLRDDDDDGDDAAGGGGRERRHSSRLTTRTNMSEDALAVQGEGASAGTGGGGDGGRGRKRHSADALAATGVDEAVLADMDDATRATALEIMEHDRRTATSGGGGGGRKRGRRTKAEQQAAMLQQQQQQQRDEDEADTPLSASPAIPSDADDSAAMADGADPSLSDSSEEIVHSAARTTTTKQPAQQRRQQPLAKVHEVADDDGDDEEEEALSSKIGKKKRLVEHEEGDDWI